MGDNLLKRTTISAMLLLGLWEWSGALATITITTDSAFQLSGSFSALSTADSETASSAIFGNIVSSGGVELLPGSAKNLNLLVLWRSDALTEPILRFQTAGVGTPGNPSFSSTFGDASRSFADVSGTYSNNLSGTPVYFLFSNLADSGGAGGLVSGNFVFSTSPINPIPEPTTYAMMMAGLGLVGLMSRRKRKQQEDAVTC